MIILDGKIVAEKIRTQLKEKIYAFSSQIGRAPQLTVILVGDDPSSHLYVRNKQKACQKVGIDSQVIHLQANISDENLKQHIIELNNDEKVDGILVQLPLPKHLNPKIVFETISPEKDSDGLSFLNLGKLWAGFEAVKPCTPSGIIEILHHYKINLSGKNVVVIGRSQIVGKPMSMLLQKENATVTMCHSKTENLKSITSLADVVVVAAGQKEFFGKEYFKQGAVVIDVGVHGAGKTSDGISLFCGDTKASELDNWLSAKSPVPGGVGPMTITMLLSNTVELAFARFNKSENK